MAREQEPTVRPMNEPILSVVCQQKLFILWEHRKDALKTHMKAKSKAAASLAETKEQVEFVFWVSLHGLLYQKARERGA